MQSDFEPKHLKKANKTLSKHLRAVEVHADTNKVYKKELFNKPSLWKKFLNLFDKYF